MKLVTIGSITVPVELVASIVAIFLAPLLFRLTTQRKSADWYWNSFILFFLTAKLSYAVFNWRMFLESPFSLLYFDGGLKGLIAAVVLINGYLYWQQRNGKAELSHEILPLFHLFFLVYLSAVNLLVVNIAGIIVYLSLLIGASVLVLQKKQLSFESFILLLLIEILGLSLVNELWSAENLAFIFTAAVNGMMAASKRRNLTRE